MDDSVKVTRPRKSVRDRPLIMQMLLSLRRAPGAVVGLVLVVVVLAGVIFAPALAPYPPTKVNLAHALAAPNFTGAPNTHVLGTDDLGRDLLSRILYGGRSSLTIAISAVLAAMVVGVVLGMLAGYFGGPLDSVISAVAEVQYTFPFMLMALVVIATLGASPRNTVIVLALNGWVHHARLARSLVLQLREADYVQAARALGQREPSILLRHIWPNFMSSTVVLSTLQLPMFLVLEASLTYLGLGPNPAIPTWGGMLADGRQYLTVAWWVGTFPGIAITMAALGVSLIGDWLRDFFDPKLA